MGRDDIYISRQVAEDLETALGEAITAPQTHPVLLHIYGIGGVGKSTLTRRITQKDQGQAKFAKVSFGATEGIDDPISLMEKLFNELEKQFPQPHLLKRDVQDVPKAIFSKPDPFDELYKQYFDTKHELETTAPDGKQVDPKQIETVKKWTGRIAGVGSGLIMSGTGVGGLLAGGAALGTSQVAEKGVDVITEGLALKDEMQRLLREHKATKTKRELQELMLDPIPKLTAAFVESTAKREQTVVLVLDTFEKVPPEVNEWLWRSLLANTAIAQQSIRIVTAGRYKLTRGENWRKLKQDRDCFKEFGLDRFDQTQTGAYLAQFDPNLPVEQIYQTTKGLPYYLDWIRKQLEKGRQLDFSQGSQEIAKLLLQGLNSTQEKVVQLAACCRWFDERMIKTLVEAEGLDFVSAVDEQWNCYVWLTQLGFAELVQRRYRLDDVARDVFREALYQRDEEGFEEVHQCLADEFRRRADRKVPAESSPQKKYNNSKWKELIAEYLYYLAFSNSQKFQPAFISYLLEGSYLRQIEICQLTLNIINAESDIEQHSLLTPQINNFLKILEPISSYGWYILNYCPKIELETMGLSQLQSEINRFSEILKGNLKARPEEEAEIQFVFDTLLKKLEEEGKNLKKEYIQEILIRDFLPEFNRDPNLLQTRQQIDEWEKSVERLGFSIEKVHKAIELCFQATKSLSGLGKFVALVYQAEEVSLSSPRSIDFRVLKLSEAKVVAETIANFLDAKLGVRCFAQGLGHTFLKLGRYEEAINSYNQALDFQADNPQIYYNKACCYIFRNNHHDALTNLQYAINLDPEWRDWAKTDSDFDPIRHHPAFQRLLGD